MRRLSLLVLPLLVAQAAAQRDARVPDPDPELERQTFAVPPGFEVTLWAADPQLAKPIQMNWDPRGRLWVAASETYPQIQPGQPANDKLLVLEDADGDGRADKTTVFADGLLIPTGLAPGDGGCYVADSTDLVHFSDPDPVTGKARKKRIVLSGFGTEDTHHILHTFRWGPDGDLYLNQSIYIHSHVETPHGVRRLNAGGVWRFRPAAARLDVFAKGFINPWGTRFDRWGQSFATDGAHFFGVTPLMPGALYPTAAYPGRTLEGLTPGSPKHCGLEVLSGRHLPPEVRGDFVTLDFRGHRVCRFKLADDGAGFAAAEQPELLKSTHPAFRPVDVAVGPDGAVYVADWYNPIIQHGEVDFRDPRRDKTHGRIWRITAKNRPPVPKPKLEGETVAGLLNQLTSPEDWTRQQAKRVLAERGAAEVLPGLKEWAAKLDPAADHARLEALWVCQAVGHVDPDLLAAVLTAGDFRSRAAACRVVADWADTLPDPLALLAPRAADPHPRVRLEAVRAAAAVPGVRAATVAASALDKPVDKWLDYAVWLTLRDLAPHWLPDVQAGKLDFGGDPKKLVFALQAAGTSDVVKPLLALLKSGKLAKDREPDVLLTLAKYGGPAELGLVVNKANDFAPADGAVAGKLLSAVDEAAAARKVGPPPGDLGGVLYFFLDEHTGPARQAACRLIGRWKDEGVRPALEHVAAGRKMVAPVSADDRRAAFDGLALFGGDKARAFLATMAGPDRKPDTRRMALVALAGLDPAAAAGPAVGYLAAAGPADAAEVIGAFAGKKDGPPALVKALAGRKLPADAARVAVRAAKAAGQPDPKLVDALTAAGGLAGAKWQLAGKEFEAAVADAGRHGDPARGEAVFRRQELLCQKCHAIAGAGGLVGPELTSIGASAPPDYLLESLLNPHAKIKEGYHSLVVTTEDDRVVTGVKVRENKDELVLRDADDREVAVPTADIASKKDGRSLMPEGLVDSLTRQELLDLVRFLSELGKGAYAATPGRAVRRWEVLQPNKELYAVVNRDRLGAVTAPNNALLWAPAYAAVSGDLPPDAVPVFRANKDAPPTGVARFRVEVSTPGKVRLVFPDPAGLTVWVGSTPVDPAGDGAVELAAGVHAVTVAVDLGRRAGKPVRAEVAEAPGSPARARAVAGK